MTTLTPTQSGSSSGGTWTDGSSFLLGTGQTGGLRFDLGAVQPRALTLQWGQLANTTGTITIGLVSTLSPPAFSNSNLPEDATTIPVAEVTKTFAIGTKTFEFDLGARLSNDPLNRSAYWVSAGGLFTGARELSIGLTISATLNTNIFIASLELVLESVPHLSGLNTAEPKRSMAAFCPRCGNPGFKEEWVRDGYTKSYVCRDCWDPPDRSEAWQRRRHRSRGIDPS